MLTKSLLVRLKVVSIKTCRRAKNAVLEKVRGVCTETGRNADMVDANEATARKRDRIGVCWAAVATNGHQYLLNRPGIMIKQHLTKVLTMDHCLRITQVLRGRHCRQNPLVLTEDLVFWTGQ